MPPHYLWFKLPTSFTRSLDFYAREGSESLVIVQDNFQDRQEVGIYAFELPAADIQNLHAEKAKANLPALFKTTALLPDERTILFAESNDGGAHYEMQSFAAKDMTPELNRLMKLFVATARPVLDHPRKVLRGDRLGGKTQLAPQEPVSFEVRFTNVGKEPLMVKNPFHPGEGVLRLHFRADKLWGSDELQESLSTDALQPVPAEAAPPPGSRLTLAPGQSLDVGFRTTLELSRGKYRAAVTFSTSERRVEGKGIPLEGDLTVDLGRFAVKRPPSKWLP